MRIKNLEWSFADLPIENHKIQTGGTSIRMKQLEWLFSDFPIENHSSQTGGANMRVKQGLIIRTAHSAEH